MNTPTYPDTGADALTDVAPVLTASNAKPAAQAEQYIRQHPGSTLLLAAGLGIAAVLLARALTPVPPRNRALRLLEDIQHRLSSLGEDGAQVVGRGMDSLGDMHLDRSFDKISRKFKGMFH